MTALTYIPFAKGHGTGNDFLILHDPQDHLELQPDYITQLCSRREGLGADGLLRLVRTTAHPDTRAMAGRAEWFMDYRNADGSTGSMCGNGARLAGRYLVDAGHHLPGHFSLATRAGLRDLHVPADPHEDVAVDMGRPNLPRPARVHVTVGERRWPALHVDVGNPHAVVFTNDLTQAGDLQQPPRITPAGAYPHGTTVEFVHNLGSHHLVVRVHERGVGETPSCGTGACAAVTAARHVGPQPAGQARYAVDFPGGRLHVDVDTDGAMTLNGPALLTARGILGLQASPHVLARAAPAATFD
ncbi:diaminopimelate epimerase [Streptomyces sp. NPDC001941]|uniref:diaminopimelate epimerase n=1 Tax=Streptomyces sp. NPDC001941 TaxID=3154659 RepID=UPI003318FFA0